MDIVRGRAMALHVVTAAGTLTVIDVYGPAVVATPGRLRRPSGLTWPCMRRPKALDARGLCSSEGILRCGWSPRDTPP